MSQRRATQPRTPTVRPGQPQRGRRELDPLRFPDCEVHPLSGELYRRGRSVSLRPQASRALALLVRERHRLVRSEEIRHALWGESAVEWQTGIHQVMRQLRSALGDDAREPIYIETLPRRGYRWKAAVLKPRRRLPVRPRDAGLVFVGLLLLPAALLLLCLVLAAT